MKQYSKKSPESTYGIDLGDRKSEVCKLNRRSGVTERFSLATTQAGIRRAFSEVGRARVVLEVGTHSPWVSRLLAELGHEVIVANPARVQLISRNYNKQDRTDAEILARLGQADPELLSPIQHRGEQSQAHLALLRAREAAVRSRTLLINSVRGQVKALGERLPSCSAAAFARKCESLLPAALRPALAELLELIRVHTEAIKNYDKAVLELAREHYPECARLRAIAGVGPLTALGFVLTLEDPGRFARSREVGPYLGLTPRRDQSGAGDKQLGISKHGDRFLRRLLVSAAHYILGPFGPASDLRSYGERLAARGGKNAKKRAVVAVARKLAVLLHHLWVSRETYDPHYQAQRSQRRHAQLAA